MWNGPVPHTDANLNSISLEYTYPEIVKASRNFSPSCLLGKGSYGAVYRGILKDGTEVAIKALNNPKDSGFKEEVLVLSKFRHPNLVILMGFSRNNKDRYLLYELLPGGDLCARLQRDAAFDWKKRLACCLDASLGLSHLHNATPKVFHRDIKTQNILLDRNGTAKMADFGLALLAQPREGGCAVEQCSGTIGYADPLYISSSIVTEKSEVYSFGMVLLEVLTGRPPALQAPNGTVQYTYQQVSDWRSVMPLVQWRAGWSPEMAQRVARLAVACIDKAERNRPKFVDIVARLRDLVNRALAQQYVQPPPQYAPPAAQYIPAATPAENIMANQAQLEEAFRRISKPSKSVPQEILTRWNPFDLDEPVVEARVEAHVVSIEVPTPPPVDDRAVGTSPVAVQAVAAKAVEAIPEPPGEVKAMSKPPVAVKAIPDSPGAVQAISEPPSESVGAVFDFESELRSMETKDDVDRAMSILFPAGAADKHDPPTPDSAIAKHLLAAGFQVDQIQKALERCSSVEAAVEWIVEQQWTYS